MEAPALAALIKELLAKHNLKMPIGDALARDAGRQRIRHRSMPC